ncbi:stabilin-1 [Pelodytes ibericus]
MTDCTFRLVLLMTFWTAALLQLRQKRCDERQVVKTETECTSCAAGIKMICSPGSKITSGTGNPGCSYTVDMGGVILSLTGCTHICKGINTIPKCCKGFWGTVCNECPGGAANPCNGHGTCLEGRDGNGTCICYEGFTGYSCNECTEEQLYGTSCSSVCECNHGICKNGISGDGSCICEAGFTGTKCDKDSRSCKALRCGKNARCIEVRGNVQCACMPGYRKKGGSCDPLDPCKPSPCSTNALCTVLRPRQHKCTCKDGYYGDGVTCTVFNPCVINNGGCPENSTRCLFRSPGKSYCSCLPGMYSRDPSAGCEASSFCHASSCDKSAYCKTTPSGKIKCFCKEGQIGDGRLCYGSILNQLNKYSFEDAQMRQQPGALRLFEEGCGLALRKYGPFTVLVPYMHFQWMNDTAVKQLCKTHMIPGQHLTVDTMQRNVLWTLSGEALAFSFKTFVKQSEPGISYTVLTRDIPASNGVIHFIDKPIAIRDMETFDNPKIPIGDILSKHEEFNRFETMLENCDLPSILNGHGSFTVFVPSNRAVDSLRDGRLIYLLTKGQNKLLELVKYHISTVAAVTVDKLITMTQIMTSANEIIKINITANGRIVLGDSEIPILHSDIVGSNGIIHILDGVLIPSSIVPILPHRCNETRQVGIKGVCSNCDSIAPCPDESIDLGSMDRECLLGNGTNTKGCARNCIQTTIELGCCSGFYGPHCLPCPAGFSNPCYGRGTCFDGMHGNGTCACSPKFKGIACHICTNPNKHGDACEEDCNCVHGYCDNRPGSGGVCQGGRCRPGYTGKFCDRTTEPCGPSEDNCHLNATCESDGNITRCICNFGYEGDGSSCQPINVCSMPDRGGCSENAVCTSHGSDDVTCQCNSGWTGDGVECLPIDNCALENRGGCDSNADCNFIQPGENDCTCRKGYTGDGYQCDPVDPCLQDNGGCHDMAECSPLSGGGRSCTCLEGLAGNGLECYGDLLMELSQNPLLTIFSLWLKDSKVVIPIEVNATAVVPSDEAAQALSEQDRKLWLDSYMLPFLIRAHFLQGSLNSVQLKLFDGKQISTLEPRIKWSISNRNATPVISNANFIKRDIRAANGFIFIIDKVLLPPVASIPPILPTLSQQLNQVPAFKVFKETFNRSGLIHHIESLKQKYTVFIPSNSAMLKFYNDSGIDKLDNRTIKYHIILGEKLSPADLKSGIHKPSLLGFSDWLMFYKQDNQTFVHNVPLDGTVFETEYGMQLGISGVLPILKNRCDTRNTIVKKTKCTNCDRSIQCPERTTLQDPPENGREKCMFKRRNTNILGCVFNCISATIVPQCCHGYFGEQCLLCPGGLDNVCSNNGDCHEGIAGDGECICKEGFHGTACESCEPGRYGQDCKSECDCVHGRCNDGQAGDGTCQCEKGWSGYICDKDIKNDLCNGTCSQNANCIPDAANTTASCSCVAGFTGNGTHCTEVNVCSISNGGCSEHANCTRIQPGQAICTCLDGYTGDGVVCIEINGCLAHNGGCLEKAECIKTGPNKVACNCQDGYKGDGIKICEPIRLCLQNNGGCSPYARCMYLGPGRRACLCNREYVGDGFKCVGKINMVLKSEAPYFHESLQLQGIKDLAGVGSFTVFVPERESFLNSTTIMEWKSINQLKYLLQHHLVGCRMLTVSDLENQTSITSLTGGILNISLKQDGIYLNNAIKITRSDIMATTGVIHFIDNVLDPEIRHGNSMVNNTNESIKLNVSEAAEFYGYSMFSKLLQDSKLLSLVNDKVHQPFTMLWPTDQAWASLPEERKNWLYHEAHRDKLVAYLKVHMIRSIKIFAANLPQAKSIRTMHGSTISFTCSKTQTGDIIVDENNSRVIERNLEFATGIAHGIDHLLEPPDIGARCDDFRMDTNSPLVQPCRLCVSQSCPQGTFDKGESRRCTPRLWGRRRNQFRINYHTDPFNLLTYCQKVCYSTNWYPECCANHYGRNCHVCPGGLEAPCNNHGQCDDGMKGTGLCNCSTGFIGSACELCSAGRYGSHCTVCSCTENGKCNAGLHGDGSCFCEEGWTGERCENKLDVRPVCSPACHANATCRANNTCECSLHYEGDGRSCNLINYCQDDNGGCSVHANCSQIEVDVTCECFPGYEGDGFYCSAIDLCTDGLNGGCSEHATCIYTGPNTRRCECHDGYVGTGVQCLEKAIPPSDRCLEQNGDCHPVATCTDLHFQETTAGIFHFQSPRGKYQLTYPEAEKACESEGATVATFKQLSAAQQMGFHLCIVGWLQNWTAGYPTTYPSPTCGSNHVGIVDYKTRTNQSEMWDVFCYRVQDVQCSCPYGYVGDGNVCNGNLLEVLETTANVSEFYSLLLNYANATDKGVEFLEFLSNGTSYKTLFVPEDGSFEKNITLTWRDLEHHVSEVDILIPYANLTSGQILPSKIGYNLSISAPSPDNCTQSPCWKVVNGKAITQWDIPAFNGIIHVIKGPLIAPVIQDSADSRVTHPVLTGLLTAALTVLLVMSATVGFFCYRQQTKGFRFVQFKSEEEEDGDMFTSGWAHPPLVSVPNPMYGESNLCYEPFEDSCDDGTG